MRELDSANAGHDVEIDVLAVLPDRAPFPPVRFDALEPAIGSLEHSLALAWRCVLAFADVDPDLVVLSVRILLFAEGFDVAIAVLIDIVDDPRFLLLAQTGVPNALPDRHCYSSRWSPCGQ